MAPLICRAGLRLTQCPPLRVQDADFSRNEILVRDGKGAKDRTTMLPASPKAPLQEEVNGPTRKAGFAKRATSHIPALLRHAALGKPADTRTAQELLDHKDVKTTTFDTYVLNRGNNGVKNPVMIRRGQMTVSYVKTLSPPTPIADHCLMLYAQMALLSKVALPPSTTSRG